MESNPERERGQLLRNRSLVVDEKFDLVWCLSGDVGNYKKHHSSRFEEVKAVDHNVRIIAYVYTLQSTPQAHTHRHPTSKVVAKALREERKLLCFVFFDSYRVPFILLFDQMKIVLFIYSKNSTIFTRVKSITKHTVYLQFIQNEFFQVVIKNFKLYKIQ